MLEANSGFTMNIIENRFLSALMHYSRVHILQSLRCSMVSCFDRCQSGVLPILCFLPLRIYCWQYTTLPLCSSCCIYRICRTKKQLNTEGTKIWTFLIFYI
ncbi:unnamed protein product [Moneuplotes crassus]|uniref:Uncharacterized protein n=1 Tax=Euplotes crassus TaxID=5936 RepID=A0AAD1UGA9_EUPCR|nr:unnamed protein product [Moneuplotes crassus]